MDLEMESFILTLILY
jgi:hypothetical protein